MEDRWKELLNQAETFSAENLSDSSKRTYASRMKVYEQVLIQYPKLSFSLLIISYLNRENERFYCESN